MVLPWHTLYKHLQLSTITIISYNISSIYTKKIGTQHVCTRFSPYHKTRFHQPKHLLHGPIATCKTRVSFLSTFPIKVKYCKQHRHPHLLPCARQLPTDMRRRPTVSVGVLRNLILIIVAWVG